VHGQADYGQADQRFDTKQLPDAPDATAPDGSDVRVLLRLGRGSMAHFELAAGRVSGAVAHHAVDELWYIVAGQGHMWRSRIRRFRYGQAPACRSRRALTSSSVPTTAARWRPWA
jgi:mannose-6-phosphate isomerase-like protein (cupin superfamily)